MWNKINQIRRFYRVSVWRTLLFNFYMLPFSQAIKLPILLTRNVRFYNLSGKVILKGRVKPAMIRFGFLGEDNLYWNSEKIILNISGCLVLTHNIHFGNGVLIRVERNANIEIEENVSISNKVKIIAYKSILIRQNTRIAWEVQILDTTFHYIRNLGDMTFGELNAPIIIGENNWIGNRTSIMKGTKTPNYTIVASGSLVNKDLNVPEYSIVAGTPVKLIKTGVYRVLSKEEKEIINSLKKNSLI
ncbi:acyltransferase [Massilibacteroides sp.]|uniref:acyltransferase n=1 Tax=Massilibacteroides sp. TaxID=2034766 RepID=UPI0026030125|nr:acyltransferase [Massilibacteroides sp.]MDD4515973.1 acyltransferase [Massilibacteroides sp.]